MCAKGGRRASSLWSCGLRVTDQLTSPDFGLIEGSGPAAECGQPGTYCGLSRTIALVRNPQSVRNPQLVRSSELWQFGRNPSIRISPQFAAFRFRPVTRTESLLIPLDLRE